MGRLSLFDGAVVLSNGAREVGNHRFAASASTEERPSDQAPSNFAVEQTAGSQRLLTAGVDMTPTVKSHDDPRIAGAFVFHAFMVVARTIGRDGACNGDG